MLRCLKVLPVSCLWNVILTETYRFHSSKQRNCFQRWLDANWLNGKTKANIMVSSLLSTASCLIAAGKTGYMSSVRNTTAPANKWIGGGITITMMMNMERRNGEMKPVIRKALVDLDGAPFKKFVSCREEWAINTDYVYPGPIQYFGPTEVCDQPTKTLKLEQGK